MIVASPDYIDASDACLFTIEQVREDHRLRSRNAKVRQLASAKGFDMPSRKTPTVAADNQRAEAVRVEG